MSKELPLSLSQHGGSSMTAGSSSSQQDEEVMVKIRLEISRLQMLERGLAESSRAFTVNDSDEERQEKRRTRVRRTVTVLVGIAVLVGVVFGIMAIVKHMKDKDVKFAQANGGNTPTSLQQLEVHNTVEDCWLVLHGNVYDLTMPFIQPPSCEPSDDSKLVPLWNMPEWKISWIQLVPPATPQLAIKAIKKQGQVKAAVRKTNPGMKTRMDHRTLCNPHDPRHKHHH
jgi:hypothetical protein